MPRHTHYTTTLQKSTKHYTISRFNCSTQKLINYIMIARYTWHDCDSPICQIISNRFYSFLSSRLNHIYRHWNISAVRNNKLTLVCKNLVFFWFRESNLLQTLLQLQTIVGQYWNSRCHHASFKPLSANIEILILSPLNLHMTSDWKS